MSFNSTIFSQILQQVNRYDFKNQVSKYNGDYKASVFKCFPVMITLMFAQLKGKQSLREIETGMNLMQNHFYHLGLKNVKRSSLSDALKVRPNEVFENYFYSLLEKIDKRTYKKFKRKLKSLDSSTISFCLQQFKWAKYKSSKAGIKLHVLFDNDLLAPVQVLITNAKNHDIEPAKKNINFIADEMYVFDRGYNDYNYWYKIQLTNAFFVTRLKKNAKIESLKDNALNNDQKKSGIISDKLVKIKSNEYPENLRVITYYDKKTKKNFRFVTNSFDVSADEITKIYKDRWKIELFFKWIKQHLKVKRFISTSENGVKLQIWIALITYLLILKIKTQLTTAYDMIEILRRLQDCLEKRINIFDLLAIKFHSKPPGLDQEKYLWEGNFE